MKPSMRGYHTYNREVKDAANERRWIFARKIMDKMLAHRTSSITISNLELQELTGVTETTLRRYLRHFKQLGVFSITVKSWPIHEDSWYVSRTITAHEDYLHLLRQARTEIN